MVNDAGLPDPYRPSAQQHAVQDLPNDALIYLLGSRYCETDRLWDTAWALFAQAPTGCNRVQAICDFVHRHIVFDYMAARSTKTAWEVFNERRGVCRDFAHLGVALCRAMNIPARYCTGYISDIGVPPPHSPIDFAGWFEAYLDGAWHTSDPRNNKRLIGRILIARGRDAVDVPISNASGRTPWPGSRYGPMSTWRPADRGRSIRRLCSPARPRPVPRSAAIDRRACGGAGRPTIDDHLAA